MPFPLEELTAIYDGAQPTCVLLAPDATVADALTSLPASRNARVYLYIMVRLPDGRYLAPRWNELELLAMTLGQELRGHRIVDLPTLAAGAIDPAAPLSYGGKSTTGRRLIGAFAAIPALEADASSLGAAREARDSINPAQRVVILRGGVPVGLYAKDLLASGDLPPDPFGPPSETAAIVGPPRSATLGDDPAADGPGTTAASAPDRVINAWVDGQDIAVPLSLSKVYELCFNIAVPRQDAVARSGSMEAAIRDATREQEFMKVLVALESDDVTLYGTAEQEIWVPKIGPSKNRVVFAIQPTKQGQNLVNALIYKDGSLFQKMTIALEAGAAPSGATLAAAAMPDGKEAWAVKATTGVTMSSAAAMPSRTGFPGVDLVIIKKEAGFQFLFQSSGFTRAFIKVTDAQLQEYVDDTRKIMQEKVVHQLANNAFVYQQQNTTIPDDVHAGTLALLADQGRYLYDELFFTCGDAAAQEIGNILRDRSRRQQLNIAIVADSQFVFPWALLYSRAEDEPVSIDGFWGFRHIIQNVPEFTQSTPVNFDPQIAVSDTLNVGFVYNTAIDGQLAGAGYPAAVQPQVDFLRNLKGIQLKEYTKLEELFGVLKDEKTAHQLLYLFCHAESNQPGEGVEGSRVILADGKATVKDMKRAASTSRPRMASAPLVFLNACESAQLSPQVYNGIVPYLIARGARGVLGTEVETPALFASEFARSFIERFAAGGETIGELLLTMRREYAEQKKNVLGLCYSLYSSGEVVVKKG